MLGHEAQTGKARAPREHYRGQLVPDRQSAETAAAAAAAPAGAQVSATSRAICFIGGGCTPIAGMRAGRQGQIPILSLLSNLTISTCSFCGARKT